MEDAIKFFSVFGGLDIPINTKIPLIEFIEKRILDDFRYFRNMVTELTKGDVSYHAILSGAALGDRRTSTAFRRSKVSKVHGLKCVDELYDMRVIDCESTMQHLCADFDHLEISEKIIFEAPFLRFWFAFISPIFKGIRDGNYNEFKKEFLNRQEEFSNLVFEQLSHEFLLKSFEDDKVDQIGSYWDDDITVDIVAKTFNGKIIAGSCKYTNSKVKKSELTRLQEDCKRLNINADMFVLFSKKGFTSELKSLKSDNIKLYTARNFKILID
jgi:hypothetical protein